MFVDYKESRTCTVPCVLPSKVRVLSVCGTFFILLACWAIIPEYTAVSYIPDGSSFLLLAMWEIIITCRHVRAWYIVARPSLVVRVRPPSADCLLIPYCIVQVETSPSHDATKENAKKKKIK